MRLFRKGIFESNSSTMHAIALLTQEEFEKWKNDDDLFVYMEYEEDADILPSWNSGYICNYLEPDVSKEYHNLEKKRLYTYDELVKYLEEQEGWNESQRKSYLEILNKYKDGRAPYFRDDDGDAMYDLDEIQFTGFYSYKLIDAFITYHGKECMKKLEKSIDNTEAIDKIYENMVAVGRYGYDG